jgi:hypothetical protein
MNTLARVGEVGGGRKQRFLCRGRRGNDEAGDDIERPGSISWVEEERGVGGRSWRIDGEDEVAAMRSVGFLLLGFNLGEGKEEGSKWRPMVAVENG